MNCETKMDKELVVVKKVDKVDMVGETEMLVNRERSGVEG